MQFVKEVPMQVSTGSCQAFKSQSLHMALFVGYVSVLVIADGADIRGSVELDVHVVKEVPMQVMRSYPRPLSSQFKMVTTAFL